MRWGVCKKNKRMYLSPEGEIYQFKWSSVKWVIIKCELRGFIVKYSNFKARKNRKGDLLLKELDKQNENLFVDPSEENMTVC